MLNRARTLPTLMIAVGLALWLVLFTDAAFADEPVIDPATAPAVLAEAPSETDDLQMRVRQLERQLQKQSEAESKKAEDARAKFSVRPFGRVHLDAATFNQDEANRATVGDAKNGVDIRRARLGVEGEGFEVFSYRFDVDFVTFDISTATRPVIVDAFLDTKEVPLVGNVRIGHFREPFGLDRLDSTHDLPFLERTAVTNALVPFRNVGLMAFNWNEGETLTWSYGLFNENTNEFGESYRDAAGMAATGRVTWLPFFEEESNGPHLLHVGFSHSYRNLGGNHSRRFAATPNVILKEGSTMRTPTFVDTGSLSVTDYHVFGVEAERMWGPFSLQGEYIFAAGQQTTGDSFLLRGGYVEAMYWWTGESRNYNRKLGIHGAVTPRTTWLGSRDENGCRTGWGAWESTLRFATIDLNDRSVQGGRMNDITVGLNWYYTVRSRVMLNYIHAMLDRDQQHSNADILAVRFQYAF